MAAAGRASAARENMKAEELVWVKSTDVLLDNEMLKAYVCVVV